MLTEALEFPFESDDWLQTVLIGGVLSLLSFLIVPGILVNGYLLRMVRAGVQADETPPKFGDWVDLFIDGILVWVVEFVYAAVPTFLLFMVVGSFAVVTNVSSSTGPEPVAATAGAFVGGVVSVLVILALLLLLAAVYLLPAALANYARTGEFTAAFSLRTVARGAVNTDYLLAMLLVIGVSIVIGLIGSLLMVVLVGVFVLFYLQLVVYHLFGQGFARGLDLDTVPDSAADTAA
ncbi:MAG: DUF4013 domain-containing protein [Halobacteriales archaeon]